MKLILSLLVGIATISAAAQNPTDQKAPVPTQTTTDTPATSISMVLPVGLNFPAILSKAIDSKKVKPGDEVTAKVSVDVAYQGQTLLPKNSMLTGHVAAVSSKGSGEDASSLTIVFDHAVLKNGQSIDLNASIRALEGPPDANVFSGGPATPPGGGQRMSTITEGTGNIGGSGHVVSGASGRNDVPGRKDLHLVNGTVTSSKDSVKLEGGSRLRLQVDEAAKK